MQAERNKIECLTQYGLFHSLFFIFISFLNIQLQFLINFVLLDGRD